MRDVKNASVAIYIPSAYSTVISKTTETFVKKFGGAINTIVEGTSENDNGDFVREKMTAIRSWYAKAEHLCVPLFIIDLAVDVKEKCNQGRIAIEVEGEMILV